MSLPAIWSRSARRGSLPTRPSSSITRANGTCRWPLRSACIAAWDATPPPAERYGSLRRILNRYNGEVNGYFLCDRGPLWLRVCRESEQRIEQVLSRQDGKLKPLPKVKGDRAVGPHPERQRESHRDWFAARLAGSQLRVADPGGPGTLLQRHVGSGIAAGLADGGDPAQGPARTPSLTEIERSDAVLVLGEDVTNAAPRMALALRQSVRQQPMEFTDKLKNPALARSCRAGG